MKQMLDPMAALELGQTFIALDNRPYKLNGVTVQFQDSRGLINLNFASQDDIYRLLGSVNVPAEDRGPLIAKLKDYMEPGDLIRLNGAKTPDYLAAGKLPPSGAPLSTPWEIWRVLDWDQQDALRDPSGSWFQSTSTTRSVGINLNTAPEAVLDIIQGMTPNAVKALMDYRAQTPLQNTNQAQALTGVGFTDDPLHYIMFPADSLRVTMKAKGGYNMTRTFAVSVTPQSTQGPWRIDFMIDLPSKSTNETDQDTDIPDLPTSPLVSAGP